MAKIIPNRVFEDYDPPSDLVTEEACDTLLIYLPGFKKEQLKVQLTISRMLKITGERPLGDNKYRRFHKEFRIPSNCDTKEISAKFEGGILYIRQPKIITPAAPPPPPPPPPPVAVQPPKLPTEAPRPQQPPPLPSQVSAPLPLPPPSPPQQQSQQQAPPLPPPSPPQPESHFQQAYPEQDEQEEPRTEERGNEEMGSREEEESRDESGVVHGPRQAIGTLGSGIFRELNQPDNLKRLGVSVLLVLIIAFYISYMFKSFMGNEQDIVSDYYEEL
ncbi:uncharacterized protein LOC141615097 [Silene latifolia]|uniref:uncharacterized protein LOC141615097 n=1 Tax=Silene latifolia TaxID=37657 RepID=UPI003D78680E